MSDFLRPHGARPLCPWDFLSKNTRVGYHACPLPRDLPNPGTEPKSPATPALQADSSLAESSVVVVVYSLSRVRLL